MEQHSLSIGRHGNDEYLVTSHNHVSLLGHTLPQGTAYKYSTMQSTAAWTKLTIQWCTTCCTSNTNIHMYIHVHRPGTSQRINVHLAVTVGSAIKTGQRRRHERGRRPVGLFQTYKFFLQACLLVDLLQCQQLGLSILLSSSAHTCVGRQMAIIGWQKQKCM